LQSVGSGGWLHITGGEPLEQEATSILSEVAITKGLRVHIQTSGSIAANWVSGCYTTVSPKQRLLMVEPDEIVLVAAKWMTIEFASDIAKQVECPIYVIPESIRGVFDCTAAMGITDTLQSVGFDARLGLQSHLIWSVR